MHIITVSGSRSGVGKTTLAKLLIRRLPGFAAIKVTITDLFTSVTDDPAMINVEGKDTALMNEAGAKAVVWVQSPPEALSESLSYALNLVGNSRGVIVEGNSPAGLLRPDTAFFVMGEDPADIKPGSVEILARADVVVVNVDADEPPPGIERAVREHNKAAVITTMRRVQNPDGELGEFFRKYES